MTDLATPNRQQWVSSEQAIVNWSDLWSVVGWCSLVTLTVSALAIF